TFTWSGIQGALSYELWVATANNSPVLLGTTNATSLTRILAAGSYDWFVRVNVDRCPSRDSQTSRITVQPSASCLDRQRAILIAPIEGAEIGAPVDFSWSAVPGATSYDLLVIRGNAQPQLIASSTVPHANGVNLDAGHVRWLVRTHFNGCAA